MICWGVVPARGGSKSIKLKNLLPLNGRPLLSYGIEAAKKSGCLQRIICSTDHDLIAAQAIEFGAEHDRRPDRLSGDDVKVDDVVQDLLKRTHDSGDKLPDAVVLIQPTSPFILPNHVVELIQLLECDQEIRSAHNVISVEHTRHAWNQRTVDTTGHVRFLFRDERNDARLKQLKPRFMVFGNLIAARTEALLDGAGFYAEPCGAIEIDRIFGFDLDGPEDVPIAQALIRTYDTDKV